jgi:hypothetical protein
MAENKTKPTKVSPASFISKLRNEQQRKDARARRHDRGRRAEPPKMGPSIIGFGSYHSRLRQRPEGNICQRISPRKRSLVPYLMSK